MIYSEIAFYLSIGFGIVSCFFLLFTQNGAKAVVAALLALVCMGAYFPLQDMQSIGRGNANAITSMEQPAGQSCVVKTPNGIAYVACK